MGCKKSSFYLDHFLPALGLSANLMQVTPICFKLKFSVEKLMELR